MTTIRHCRHCWGNCLGDCIMDDTGRCIHEISRRAPWRLRMRYLLSGERRRRRLF
jgi:hypothetical protein